MIHCLLLLFSLMHATADKSKRTVMIFSDATSQKQLQLQQKLLATDKQGCDEREIIIKTYTPEDMMAYKKNHIRNGFTVLLIGKDGGEKLRSHTPVTVKKLFSLIDAMPMRKDEISRAGGYDD